MHINSLRLNNKAILCDLHSLMMAFFTDYVKTLDLRREDFEKAVDLAPSIKPFRYTYLHEQQYRDRAKELLHTDARLQEILK